MKSILAILSAAAVTVPFLGFAPSAQADENAEIIYQSSGRKNIYQSAEAAIVTPTKAGVSAPIRVQYDANVYREEGKATAREEHMTHVLSLYIECENPTVVYAGHSLAN